MTADPLEIPPTWANIRALWEATERLRGTCERLTDADVTVPSALPGWTRGHVLNHLARQAPALERLLDWAATGVENPQYTSREARRTEIEEGADRSAVDLVSDLLHTADHLQKVMEELPEAAWGAHIRPVTGETCTARRVLVIRLREIEVHHTDLASGYTFADIPSPVAGVILDDVATHLRGLETMPAFELRNPQGRAITAFGDAYRERCVITGSVADALGWLTGRTHGEGLNSPDGLPALPGWI